MAHPLDCLIEPTGGDVIVNLPSKRTYVTQLAIGRPQQELIPSIQYLRALAALSVCWYHALNMLPHLTEFLGRPRFHSSGVDLFFVISGFIMFDVS
jgi:peptidoglycan/LPS O-acetylase OafA/YrhL